MWQQLLMTQLLYREKSCNLVICCVLIAKISLWPFLAQKMPKSVEKEKSPQNQIWFRRFRHFPLCSAALHAGPALQKLLCTP
jgi:hypothetical protein